MPMYDHRCGHCGSRATLFLKIAQLGEVAPCPRCTQPMARQISAPMVRGDYAGYSCPITGRWVEGRRAHAENLAQHGCRVFEPGEREAADRYRAAQEEALLTSVGETVEAEIHAMSPQKRDSLAADLEHFSADVVRN